MRLCQTLLPQPMVSTHLQQIGEIISVAGVEKQKQSACHACVLSSDMAPVMMGSRVQVPADDHYWAQRCELLPTFRQQG